MQSHELLPEDRSPWGPQIERILTKEGQAAFEDALRIYAGSTKSELSKDPAKKIELYREAAPLMEEVIAEAIKRITNAFTHKSDRGLLTKSILEIIEDIFDPAIEAKYPEHDGINDFGEGLLIGELKERIQSYFLTMTALREKEHREMHKGQRKKKKSRRRKVPAPEEYQHGSFFQILDNLTFFAPQMNATTRVLFNQFIQAKEHWVPFLRRRKFSNPLGHDPETLRADNERIAAIVEEKMDREVPLCTLQNRSLLVGTGPSQRAQFAPVDDPLQPAFPSLSAQINYYDEAEVGKEVTRDREIQESIRAQTLKTAGATQSAAVQFGSIPSVFLRRGSGEIQGINLYPETLKLLAGNNANYELLRRDILWYFAQLTCKRRVLEEIFGNTFARQKKRRLKGIRRSRRRQKEEAPNEGITRNFPMDTLHDDMSFEDKVRLITALAKGTLEEETEEDIEEEEGSAPEEIVVQQRVDEAVGGVRRKVEYEAHKVLLPLTVCGIVQKGDQMVPVYESPKPSAQAKELAAQADKKLYDGIEFPELGVVVYPDIMDAFIRNLQQNGVEVSSLEDLTRVFEGQAYIRHETWRKGHVRGEGVGDDSISSAAVDAKTRPRSDSSVHRHRPGAARGIRNQTRRKVRGPITKVPEDADSGEKVLI